MPKARNINFSAVILDIDGVLTKTATHHARTWKKMFAKFLKEKQGDNFQPLDIEEDYNEYIDGKPRRDGIRSFLNSKKIDLPEGEPGDAPEKDRLEDLAKRKNNLFLQINEKEGVDVYHDSLKILKKWKGQNIKLAVLSSSRNCKLIINKAGLTSFFSVRVDGITSEKENLKGKPNPDILLKAAENLKVNPGNTIVAEDAISGVKAGKRGEFALVIGVDRGGKKEKLEKAGADLIITDMTKLKDLANA
ncbi:MAG TPA: beta-phosphoglucomutase family hydrolase [Salegentibacter sp.]|nr:beta-phosphoglucomutase family hydrolase [Salegentibacter sp.]